MDFAIVLVAICVMVAVLGVFVPADTAEKICVRKADTHAERVECMKGKS